MMFFPSGRAGAAALITGLAMGLAAVLPASAAVTVQRVVSPGGIEAWLVEDHTVAMLAFRAEFQGGTQYDPADKRGVTHLLSTMLDEGAGDLDSEAFQTRLQDLNMRLSFDASRDTFSASLETLIDKRDDAFDMLRLALSEPRFDAQPLERMRRKILTSIEADTKDPQRLAGRALFEAVFQDHPYAAPVKGTLDSVAALTADDLRDQAGRLLTRDRLFIGVSGAISAAELGPLLDQTFGDLPAASPLDPNDHVTINGPGRTLVVPFPVPQSTVMFGHQGIKREDEDFIAAYVMNYTLGGGGFSSRLMTEVREKRGLAYSVYSYLYPLDSAELMLGGLGTANDRVAESIAVVRAELERMAKSGPTADELENAKTYLTGAYPLRFDSNSKIAGNLVSLQIDGLGIDYLEKRNGLIEAVTLEDIRRVAARVLRPGELVVAVVGEPVGLDDAEVVETR